MVIVAFKIKLRSLAQAYAYMKPSHHSGNYTYSRYANKETIAQIYHRNTRPHVLTNQQFFDWLFLKICGPALLAYIEFADTSKESDYRAFVDHVYALFVLVVDIKDPGVVKFPVFLGETLKAPDYPITFSTENIPSIVDQLKSVVAVFTQAGCMEKVAGVIPNIDIDSIIQSNPSKSHIRRKRRQI